MSGTKFFLDSEVHFFSPYLIHRSESLSSYRFLYFVFYFNQSRGLWVLLVHELIGCFCSFENIHSGSWGFISRDHRRWGMGVSRHISKPGWHSHQSFQPHWQPTPVLLPGKSQGWRSLVGCSPWGRKESDTTERCHFHLSHSCIGDGLATHFSVLAWRIPGIGEPGGLLSMGSHRVGHD